MVAVGAKGGGFGRVVAADAAASRAFQKSKFGYVPLTWFLDPGFVAVFLARLQFACDASGWNAVATFLGQLNSILTGADVESSSRVGPGWLMPNPLGVSFWADAGCDLTVGTLSGTGHAISGRLAEGGRPRLGDRVMLGAFSGIQGPLTIGNDVQILSGCGTRRDVQPCTAIGPGHPAGPGAPPPEGPDRKVAPCDHHRFSNLARDFSRDLDRTVSEMDRMGFVPPSRWRLIIRNMFVAIFVHRLSHHAWRRGWVPVARALAGINRLIFKLTIPPQTCLGGGVMLPHLAGGYLLCTAGAGLTAYAQSWIGGTRTGLASAPDIGTNVFLAAHTAAIGPRSIGDHAVIGVKSTVLEDIPAGARVNSPAAIFRPMEPLVNDIGRKTESGETHQLRTLIREDRVRARQLAADGIRVSLTARLAVRLYRFSAAADEAGQRRLARWLWWINRVFTGLDISPGSRIGRGFVVLVPAGVTIHAQAGAGMVVYGQSVIGADLTAARGLVCLEHAPQLGDRVTVHPHTVICGPRAIGDDCRLYAGSVQAPDCEAGASVVPPRIRVNANIGRGRRDDATAI